MTAIRVVSILIWVTIFYLLTCVFALSAMACPLRPVDKLPSHLFDGYCSCYKKTIYSGRTILLASEQAELLCAGKAWDLAHKESLIRRWYGK